MAARVSVTLLQDGLVSFTVLPWVAIFVLILFYEIKSGHDRGGMDNIILGGQTVVWGLEI